MKTFAALLLAALAALAAPAAAFLKPSGKGKSHSAAAAALNLRGGDLGPISGDALAKTFGVLAVGDALAGTVHPADVWDKFGVTVEKGSKGEFYLGHGLATSAAALAVTSLLALSGTTTYEEMGVPVTPHVVIFLVLLGTAVGMISGGSDYGALAKVVSLLLAGHGGLFLVRQTDEDDDTKKMAKVDGGYMFVSSLFSALLAFGADPVWAMGCTALFCLPLFLSVLDLVSVETLFGLSPGGWMVVLPKAKEGCPSTNRVGALPRRAKGGRRGRPAEEAAAGVVAGRAERAERSFRAMEALSSQTFVVTEENMEWSFDEGDEGGPLEPACRLILPRSEAEDTKESSAHNCSNHGRASNECLICMAEAVLYDPVSKKKKKKGGTLRETEGGSADDEQVDGGDGEAIRRRARSDTMETAALSDSGDQTPLGSFEGDGGLSPVDENDVEVSAGKGTYGELLAARFNGTCLNIGEILRERSIEDNELRATMRSGGMVSDEYINDLLIPRLKTPRLLREWPKNLRPTMAIQFDVPDEAFEDYPDGYYWNLRIKTARWTYFIGLGLLFLGVTLLWSGAWVPKLHILPDGSTVSAGDKPPKLPLCVRVLDVVGSFVFLPFAVVWFWRGTWLLCDHYFWGFSPDSQDLYNSKLWGAIFTAVCIVITSEPIVALVDSKIKNKTMLGLLGRLRTYILAWGTVLACLAAVGCVSSIMAPASTMGVDAVPHEHCADEPLFSMLPIPYELLYMAGIARQESARKKAEVEMTEREKESEETGKRSLEPVEEEKEEGFLDWTAKMNLKEEDAAEVAEIEKEAALEAEEKRDMFDETVGRDRAFSDAEIGTVGWQERAWSDAEIRAAGSRVNMLQGTLLRQRRKEAGCPT
ncbi:hypothetical protein ACHAXT_000165 [Thalassiosira profunda]